MKTTIIQRDVTTGRNVGHDFTGQTFGSLTIDAATGDRCPHGYMIWRAHCGCGTEVVLPSYRFTRGSTKTCRACAPVGRPRIPDKGAHVNALFASRRDGAIRRGYAWELSIETFRALCEGDCHYCGIKPQPGHTHRNLSGSYEFNGIDRTDNAGGYVTGNVVSCCWECNHAKGTRSYADFIAWIDVLVRHRNGLTHAPLRV